MERDPTSFNIANVARLALADESRRAERDVAVEGQMLTVTLHIQGGSGGTWRCEGTLARDEGKDPRGHLVIFAPGADAVRLPATRRTLTGEEAERLWRSLTAATLSPLPDYAMGQGGTFYMLKMERGFNSTTFTWWNTLPEAWRGLGEVLEALTGMGEFGTGSE